MAMDIYIYINMTPKEKYINYVVEDLVKNTRIGYNHEHNKELVTTPFNYPSTEWYKEERIIQIQSKHFSTISATFTNFYPFTEYLTNRYGAREEEMELISDQYRDKILSLIKK